MSMQLTFVKDLVASGAQLRTATGEERQGAFDQAAERVTNQVSSSIRVLRSSSRHEHEHEQRAAVDRHPQRVETDEDERHGQ